uniref:Membrane protein ORF94 n=1 Tax=Anguillid herpesvirus 1 TaxID=150286 RepID=A0A8E5AKD9_9VIRU|nr:membrane protein ORF94 [Anguillid herpesvirus 1]
MIGFSGVLLFATLVPFAVGSVIMASSGYAAINLDKNVHKAYVYGHAQEGDVELVCDSTKSTEKCIWSDPESSGFGAVRTLRLKVEDILDLENEEDYDEDEDEDDEYEDEDEEDEDEEEVLQPQRPPQPRREPVMKTGVWNHTYDYYLLYTVQQYKYDKKGRELVRNKTFLVEEEGACTVRSIENGTSIFLFEDRSFRVRVRYNNSWVILTDPGCPFNITGSIERGPIVLNGVDLVKAGPVTLIEPGYVFYDENGRKVTYWGRPCTVEKNEAAPVCPPCASLPPAPAALAYQASPPECAEVPAFNGPEAGIGVGLTLIVILTIISICFCCDRRRTRRREKLVYTKEPDDTKELVVVDLNN